MNTRVYTFDTVWPRLAAFGLLLTVAMLAPVLGWPQPVTGPLVNALLLITVETLGLWPAIALGTLTPLGAMFHGVLPLPLAVMTPFIMLGNATIVTVFNALRSRNRWLALSIGATAKFALLYGVMTFFVARPLELGLSRGATTIVMPSTMVNMMSWPQLATAVAGGLLAFAVMHAIRNPVSRWPGAS